MNHQLSPQQIVAWMRTKATNYNKMADELEADYSATAKGGESPTPQRQTNGHNPEPLTEDRLFEAVQKKSGRVVHYAERLHVSEEEIQRVLNLPNCRVEVGDRGWFKIKDATLQLSA